MELKNETGYNAWLEGYSNEATKRVLGMGYKFFVEFLEESTKQKWTDQKLIKERIEDVDTRSYIFEQKLIKFYNWLRLKDVKNREGKLSDNTRKSYLKGIRSFFAFHRLDFKLTNQQKMKLSKKPKPRILYYDFSLDDITKMSKFASPKERYILLCGKDLGLRAGDFTQLKQGLFSHIRGKEQPYSLGKIYTVKEGVYAFCFLSNEGKNAAETWLSVIDSKGLRDNDKPMLKINKKELSENLKRLANKAGIQSGTVRFHALRRFLIDRLSSTTSESKWKQIVGKEIAESAYVSDLQLREIYARVLPLIETKQFTESNHVKLDVLKDAISDMEKENRVLKARIDLLQNDVERAKEETEEFVKKLMVEYIKRQRLEQRGD